MVKNRNYIRPEILHEISLLEQIKHYTLSLIEELNNEGYITEGRFEELVNKQLEFFNMRIEEKISYGRENTYEI